MTDIYVGRYQNDFLGISKDELVLKYPVGHSNRPLCRYYPLEKGLEETLRHTGRWLKFSGITDPRFLELSDPDHKIFPFTPDIEANAFLLQGFNEGFRR